jgi:hypothetical protein
MKGAQKMSQENSQPIFKTRSGTVSTAVWENTIKKNGEELTLYNIKFQRSYKDGETGEWKNTDSFTPQSLGNLLINVLATAMHFANINPNNSDDIPI